MRSSRAETIIRQWAQGQAELGNPRAPNCVEDLNRLGPVRDWRGAQLRTVIIADLVRLTLATEAPAAGMLCHDGVWRLTDAERMRCLRAIDEVLGVLSWGVLISVIPELPTGPEGKPSGEVRIALSFVFLDPELREQLGLPPVRERPHAQA